MATKRMRWLYLYFGLALFDVLTVSGSLYLNHRIMDLYATSGSENVVWARRLDAYAELGAWATAVNAPGNDVFDSRDVAKERARVEAANAVFHERLMAARSELADESDRAAADDLTADLSRVHEAMEAMTAEAARIFVFFEGGQPDRAGERMATMDRKYATLLGALGELSGRVRQIQGERFELQLARAEALRSVEWGIASLVLVMITGAMFFGHRVKAQMEATEREREAHNEAAQRAQAAAESANRAKSRFLATMSHEIRTPLNGVLGMTELLMSTPLQAEQQEFASTIQQSGIHLLDVINDILDFSKIEADQVELESLPVDLAELVEDVAVACAERAHRKQLELVHEVDRSIPLALLGDGLRLRQILLNLTANAIKFTGRGEVAIRAARVERPGDEVARILFSVSDTGIGIDDDQRARIFSPFTQADETTTRRFGGTGLGLAISKDLVERMGGVLKVESVLGLGSRFSFELELRRASIESAPASVSDRTGLESLRVLVVDDNATNRTILLRHLQAWGAEGVECVNGSEALATLRRSRSQGNPFDVGIFDLAMPGMDGLSLCEALEADPAIGRLPVVMLTSMDISSEAEPRRPTSIVARLSKPCRRAHLRRALVAASGRGAGAAHGATLEPATTPDLALEVLLVEDNPVNQRVGVAMLTRLGCRVHVAASGREALEQAESTSPDLILMDCELPDFDGLEVTRQIRARAAAEGADPVPILALTAHATAVQRQACLAAGMDGFLTKPVTFDALTDFIESHTRKRPSPSSRASNRGHA